MLLWNGLVALFRCGRAWAGSRQAMPTAVVDSGRGDWGFNQESWGRICIARSCVSQRGVKDGWMSRRVLSCCRAWRSQDQKQDAGHTERSEWVAESTLREHAKRARQESTLMDNWKHHSDGKIDRLVFSWLNINQRLTFDRSTIRLLSVERSWKERALCTLKGITTKPTNKKLCCYENPLRSTT